MSAEHDASAYAPESPGRPPVLYEVTAVDTEAGTCTVQPVYDPAQTLVDAGERDDVVFLTASAPSAGATGMLLTLSNGNVVFFAGGDGASVVYARAKAHMSADDSPHTAETYNADGTPGADVTVRRPYDRFVTEGTFGCIVVDAGGQNLFIPMGGFVEARTETMGDPASPAVGQQWMILPDDQF